MWTQIAWIVGIAAVGSLSVPLMIFVLAECGYFPPMTERQRRRRG